jgi:hypothetical protein
VRKTINPAKKRTARANASSHPVAVRITERDLWLLEGLAKMRFLTTGQLARLYFNGSHWSANKRLRKLLDAGLLNVWVRSLSEENIYSITKNGLGTLEDQNGERPKVKIPYGLDENLSHLLAINDVRASLASNLPEANAEIIWWRSDWELRAHGRERIIPDGLFLIKWHGIRDQAYALEVDNNTRSSRNFMKKILAYASLQFRFKGVYGVTDPIILVAGADPKWLERYRTLIKQLRLHDRAWFATLDDIKREGAATAVWVNREEKKYSLRELTFCPYRKDGTSRQTIGV